MDSLVGFDAISVLRPSFADAGATLRECGRISCVFFGGMVTALAAVYCPVFLIAEGDSPLCPLYFLKQTERMFHLQALVEVALADPLPALVQFKFQIMKRLDVRTP